MTLITSYVNPDLDGVACAVAMEELLRAQGHEARGVVFGTPQLEARWMCNTFKIASPEDGSAMVHTKPEVILVDASNPKEISEAFNPELVTEIIDHRAAHHAREFANVSRVQIELVGACATLVTERLVRTNMIPSQNVARLLYGAIVSNTVNFRSPQTTDRDHAAAAWLKPLADLPQSFARKLFAAKSDLLGDELRKALIDDYVLREFGGKRLAIFQLEVVDAEKFINEHLDEIREIIQAERAQEQMDYVMLNGLDTLAATSVLVVFDDASRNVAQTALGRTFIGDRSKLNHLEMRKQMTPKLQAFLERK